jgi:hypothetical protein
MNIAKTTRILHKIWRTTIGSLRSTTLIWNTIQCTVYLTKSWESNYRKGAVYKKLFLIVMLWWDKLTITKRNSAYIISTHLSTNSTSQKRIFCLHNNMKAICNKIGISYIRTPGYPNMRQWSLYLYYTLFFSSSDNRMIKPEYHCLKLYKLIHNPCLPCWTVDDTNSDVKKTSKVIFSFPLDNKPLTPRAGQLYWTKLFLPWSRVWNVFVRCPWCDYWGVSH